MLSLLSLDCTLKKKKKKKKKRADHTSSFLIGRKQPNQPMFSLASPRVRSLVRCFSWFSLMTYLEILPPAQRFAFLLMIFYCTEPLIQSMIVKFFRKTLTLFSNGKSCGRWSSTLESIIFYVLRINYPLLISVIIFTMCL